MSELFIFGIEAGMSKSANSSSAAINSLDDALRALGARESQGFLGRIFSKGKKTGDDVISRLNEFTGGGSLDKGLGLEIQTARQNILNEAAKRMGVSAIAGAGVGGATGAAMADPGQGTSGFLRGAALGGLGGAALGGHQANRIRQSLNKELSGAGVSAGKRGLSDFLDLSKMKTINVSRDGLETVVNPTRAAMKERLQGISNLQGNLGTLADDVAGQSFMPLGAAGAGAAAGVAGTVGYNAGRRYMDQNLGGKQLPPQPPMMPPPMMPPPMARPLYGYYPYGGR